MRLIRHYPELAIVKLPAGDAVPDWALLGCFSSTTRTPDELSVVCESRRVPAHVARSDGWVWLEVEGPLSLSLVGVLTALTGLLAEAGVSVFAIATHDTDHLLIRGREEQIALDALVDAGHVVVTAEPHCSSRHY